jgi:transcriptional regulator GlxA family with amidase domain
MTSPPKTESILCLLYPGCITYEVALALELLGGKYQVLCATPDGRAHQASNGTTIEANHSFQDVELTNCAAILVPGGNPDSIADNKDIDRILHRGAKKDVLLAAICAGPFLLAKAGILRGRRIAHGYGPEQLEFLEGIFAGVQLTDEAIVWDGNILTAKPFAHIDFGVEIAARLGAIHKRDIEALKRYYQGLV